MPQIGESLPDQLLTMNSLPRPGHTNTLHAAAWDLAGSGSPEPVIPSETRNLFFVSLALA